MPMISYAQNREDVLLDRLFRGPEPGYYLDVGANDPVVHSVTKHFSNRGWRGINVEPHPVCFDLLRQDRPRDVNLQAGVSDHEGTLTFFEAEESGWSTFSTLQAANLRASGMRLTERTVPVLTLAAICRTHVPDDQTISFLKVDAESHEREVLSGADWSRWRPRAVLVEANGFEAWEPILLDADYLYATHDGVNRFYVRAEEPALREALAVPANVTDEFVPFEYQREIDRLRAELVELGSIGPGALALARRVQLLARRHPAVAATFKRIFRRAV